MPKRFINCCMAIFITFLPVAAAAADTTDETLDPILIKEGPCSYIFEKTKGPNKGGYGYSDAGIVQVMRDTQEGLLKIKPSRNSKIISIVCSRSTPIPHPLDYRVILSGYEFSTTNMRGYREFATTLKKLDGVYTLTMRKGELTPAEQKVIDQLLAQFLEDEKEFLKQ